MPLAILVMGTPVLGKSTPILPDAKLPDRIAVCHTEMKAALGNMAQVDNMAKPRPIFVSDDLGYFCWFLGWCFPESHETFRDELTLVSS